MRLNHAPTTLADFHIRKGDTIFRLGAVETTVRFVGDGFLVLYLDGEEVKSLVRKTDADAFRLAIYVSRWGHLPPSARRSRVKTLTGMTAVEVA
jgi:hypothetical protein